MNLLYDPDCPPIWLLKERDAQRAEIARLRAENEQFMEQIALRQPSVVECDMQLVMQSNNKLRAALEQIMELETLEDGALSTSGEIARKALANE